MLVIEDLHVSTEDQTILKGLSLEVNKGEVHAIMGPNGAGKSTLAKALMGDPSYRIIKGNITFCGQSLLDLAPEERSLLGLFMGFQYPIEIPGVTNYEFLKTALNARKKLTKEAFNTLLQEKSALVQIPETFLHRDVNSGFSGGEKKKNEILQMALLDPKLAILDETDSGLDIDAIRVVANGMNALMNKENACILITHYQRLLDYVHVDFVHVLVDGKIVSSGGPNLAYTLEEKGYESNA